MADRDYNYPTVRAELRQLGIAAVNPRSRSDAHHHLRIWWLGTRGLVGARASRPTGSRTQYALTIEQVQDLLGLCRG
jgi:hypothetical protein